MVVYVVELKINKGWGLRGPVNRWETVEIRVYNGKKFAMRKAEEWRATQRYRSDYKATKKEVIFPSL